ncbi:LacI family DNA-binding transcriptional regulator [Poriferisphaera sp. WC338]|uniref:LacI family DNA-binding transcriptional regulator n=1 Tax=Poriferisphaera sp. WC338 TaxID=3425129 RepID=UPI003D815849
MAQIMADTTGGSGGDEGQSPEAGKDRQALLQGSALSKQEKSNGGKRVGIREIARQAGVSVATVSMVLNNNPKITEPTRQKVNKVIERVGYRPNRLAQSLSGRYTRVISILMPTLRHAMADPYFGELISGICDRAARLGHKVMLEHAKPDFIKERRHVELFERRFIDGALCIGFNDRHSFMKDFSENGHPMVVVNNKFPQWDLDHVVCDYRSGAEQVMTYLQQLGHRKIGMVHGALEVFTSREILDVYKRRMANANVEGFDDTWICDGRFTEEHGAEATAKLLEAHPDMTAIFAGNDKMALGAIHWANRHGRNVPGDLSIVGFDDIQYTAFVNPTLTTVHLPLYELGVMACERLVERIRGKADRAAAALPTHLVLRESTSMAASFTPGT